MTNLPDRLISEHWRCLYPSSLIQHVMGATTEQQARAESAQPNERDSLQVRGDSQHTAASTQSGHPSSYVPPHPNIQATQTFLDSPSTPAAPGAPAPAVQGYSVGPINTTQPLYCPAQQVERAKACYSRLRTISAIKS